MSPMRAATLAAGAIAAVALVFITAAGAHRTPWRWTDEMAEAALASSTATPAPATDVACQPLELAYRAGGVRFFNHFACSVSDEGGGPYSVSVHVTGRTAMTFCFTDGRCTDDRRAQPPDGVARPFAVDATPQVARIGRGIGVWRLEQRFRVRPDLVNSVRYPKNGGPGCLLGPWNATRIDYYAGIRVSWLNGYLFDIASTRDGDRTTAGLAIGTTRFAAVRKRYPKAAVGRGPYPGAQIHPRPPRTFNLGARTLVRTRKTGDETWNDLIYWFDRRGTLAAVEVTVGGC